MLAALVEAVKKNKLARVKQLIERGADVNGIERGRTSLYGYSCTC